MTQTVMKSRRPRATALAIAAGAAAALMSAQPASAINSARNFLGIFELELLNIRGGGVRVANVEGGHPLPTHKALQGQIELQIGWPFARAARDVTQIVRDEFTDEFIGRQWFSTHATAMASAIVGNSQQDQVIGMAPNAKLLSGAIASGLSTAGLSGEGGQLEELSATSLAFALYALTDQQVADAIAAELGIPPYEVATVVNLPFGIGGTTTSPARRGDDSFSQVVNSVVTQTGATIIAAAGNDGDDISLDQADPPVGSMRSPGAAHNTIGVGSTNDTQGGEFDSIRPNSSRGPIPAIDWRVAASLVPDDAMDDPGTGEMPPTEDEVPEARPGPDLVSPGFQIRLAGSEVDPAENPSPQAFSDFWSGTSVASSITTGAVALIHQLGTREQLWFDFDDVDPAYNGRPSHLLTRVILLNSCQRLGGYDSNGRIIDINTGEGWNMGLGLDFEQGAGRIDFERLRRQFIEASVQDVTNLSEGYTTRLSRECPPDPDGTDPSVQFLTEEQMAVLRQVRENNYDVKVGELLVPGQFVPPAQAYFGLSVADVDNDSRNDIVAITDNRRLLYFQSDGAAVPGFKITLISDSVGDGTLNSAISVVDFDGDGDFDILANFNDTALEGGTTAETVLLSNNGDRPPAFDRTQIALFAGKSVQAADFNGDTNMDVVLAAGTSILWYENDGDTAPAFTPRVVATGVVADAIRAVNIDGDDDVDIVALTNAGLFWYENIGGEMITFSPVPIDAAASLGRNLIVRDMNGDGSPDIVTVNGSNLVVRLSNGMSPPSFASSTVLTSLVEGIDSVIAVDVDGDGARDLVAASNTSAEIIWLRNDGAASSTFSENFLTADPSSEITFAGLLAAGAVNSDGRLDVTSASLSNGRIAWYQADNGVPPVFTRRLVTDGTATEGSFIVPLGTDPRVPFSTIKADNEFFPGGACAPEDPDGSGPPIARSVVNFHRPQPPAHDLQIGGFNDDPDLDGGGRTPDLDEGGNIPGTPPSPQPVPNPRFPPPRPSPNPDGDNNLEEFRTGWDIGLAGRGFIEIPIGFIPAGSNVAATLAFERHEQWDVPDFATALGAMVASADNGFIPGLDAESARNLVVNDLRPAGRGAQAAMRVRTPEQQARFDRLVADAKHKHVQPVELGRFSHTVTADGECHCGSRYPVVPMPDGSILPGPVAEKLIGEALDAVNRAPKTDLATRFARGTVTPTRKFAISIANDEEATDEFIAGIQQAATLWESVIGDDVIIRINVGFAAGLGSVIAAANSTTMGLPYSDFRQALVLDANDGLDAMGNADGTPNEKTLMESLPANASSMRLRFFGRPVDQPNIVALSGPFESAIAFTSANGKALGLVDESGEPVLDATITFNTDFTPVLNPNGPLDMNEYDIVAVMAHEMGHMLGFVSGVDQFGGLNNLPNALDIFRFADGASNSPQQLADPLQADPLNVDDFTNFRREFSYGIEANLDTVGALPGVSPSNSEIRFSTGSPSAQMVADRDPDLEVYMPDGRQASHWKDDSLLGLGQNIGIMDPTFEDGQVVEGFLTQADLIAFSLIGWDIDYINFTPIVPPEGGVPNVRPVPLSDESLIDLLEPLFEFEFENLDLELIRLSVGDGEPNEVIAVSQSQWNNIEFIAVGPGSGAAAANAGAGLPGGQYLLRIRFAGTTFDLGGSEIVSTDSNGVPGFTDLTDAQVPYALAWYIDLADIEGDAGTSPASLRADLSSDGVIDATDLAMLLGVWGTDHPSADLNGDGKVNAADMAALLGAFSAP